MAKPTKWHVRPASAQTDQSLRCALNEKLRIQCFFMRTAKTLFRLGGCHAQADLSLLWAHVGVVMLRLISAIPTAFCVLRFFL